MQLCDAWSFFDARIVENALINYQRTINLRHLHIAYGRRFFVHLVIVFTWIVAVREERCQCELSVFITLDILTKLRMSAHSFNVCQLQLAKGIFFFFECPFTIACVS